MHYVIGLSALALAGAATIKTPVSKTVVVPAAQVTATGRYNPYVWEGLQQSEVDALQKALEGMPKKPVIIFCSDANCQDIVLDFDNAFESAHWSTDIERPMIDSSVGIWTSSKELAAAIAAATNGRLKVSILGPEWKKTDTIALAIGKKPR
jgi:hypothetical protein